MSDAGAHDDSSALQRALERQARAALEDPSFELRLSGLWNGSPAGRILIRAALRERALRTSPELVADANALLELGRPPAHPAIRFSVSHSAGLGGFVCSERGIGIGFDVESASRVREAVALRIAGSREEYDRAPSPVALWTAKEAAYKASLESGAQPAASSQIAIVGWRPIAKPARELTELGAIASQCEARLAGAFESSTPNPRRFRFRGLCAATKDFAFCFFAMDLN